MSERITVGVELERGLDALSPFSGTAYLDVLALMSQATGQTREWLLAHTDTILKADERKAFRERLSRCLGGEALPYILGWWEFYGRKFNVQPSVLIPRPETEHIIENALSFLRDRSGELAALDVGTGSGCIAITLAIEIPQLKLVALDLSFEALLVARRNARLHHVGDRIQFIQADLLRPLEAEFDLLCANLPYIPTNTLPGLEVARREPWIALDGGPEGLALIRRLLSHLPGLIKPGGSAIIEIGADQGSLIERGLALQSWASKIEIRKDLAGLDRLLVLQF